MTKVKCCRFARHGENRADGIPRIVFNYELEVACPDLPASLIRQGSNPTMCILKVTKAQFMLALNQLFVSLQRRCAGAPSVGSAHTWERVVKDTINEASFRECAEEASKFQSNGLAATSPLLFSCGGL